MANNSTSSTIDTAEAVKIILPDLVSHCDFEIRINPHRKHAAAASKEWLFQGDQLPEKKRQKYHGLKAGLLTAMCYPDAGYAQLRVCSDFMNYLFHLDNLSDEMDTQGTRATADVVMNALYHPNECPTSSRIGKMTNDFWTRFLATSHCGSEQRFIETFDFFFQAITQQALDRHRGTVPNLESYITMRRDTSGCKPCWALIEYANDLDIPDYVMDSPALRNLGEAANDLVTWSNDIFSYDVEQSKGDTHNMISVLMNIHGLELQDAIDFVGDLCKQSIDRFTHERDNLPIFGPTIDKDVEIYVSGLASWIVGSLHWSFESERYFGKKGKTVKSSRIIALRPSRIQNNSE